MEFIFPDGFSVILSTVPNPWLDAEFADKTKIDYADFVLLAGKAMPESDEFIIVVNLWQQLLHAHKEILEGHKNSMEECEISIKARMTECSCGLPVPDIKIAAKMIAEDNKSLAWNKRETDLFMCSLRYTLSRVAVPERIVEHLSAAEDAPHSVIRPVTRACARICSARLLDRHLDTLTEKPRILELDRPNRPAKPITSDITSRLGM